MPALGSQHGGLAFRAKYTVGSGFADAWLTSSCGGTTDSQLQSARLAPHSPYTSACAAFHVTRSLLPPCGAQIPRHTQAAWASTSAGQPQEHNKCKRAQLAPCAPPRDTAPRHAQKARGCMQPGPGPQMLCVRRGRTRQRTMRAVQGCGPCTGERRKAWAPGTQPPSTGAEDASSLLFTCTARS